MTRECWVSVMASIKVPTSTLCHTAQIGKVQQKLRHATSICGRCVGLAAACRSMLCGLKIQSANCRSHQKKSRGIWWIRGFKMVSVSLKKKITPSSPISFHSFGNLKKVCKKCGRDCIGGICQATFAAWQSYSVLHSVARHSVDASLRFHFTQHQTSIKKLHFKNKNFTCYKFIILKWNLSLGKNGF